MTSRSVLRSALTYKHQLKTLSQKLQLYCNTQQNLHTHIYIYIYSYLESSLRYTINVVATSRMKSNRDKESNIQLFEAWTQFHKHKFTLLSNKMPRTSHVFIDSLLPVLSHTKMLKKMNKKEILNWLSKIHWCNSIFVHQFFICQQTI